MEEKSQWYIGLEHDESPSYPNPQTVKEEFKNIMPAACCPMHPSPILGKFRINMP
jgi:hypothetical protein